MSTEWRARLTFLFICLVRNFTTFLRVISDRLTYGCHRVFKFSGILVAVWRFVSKFLTVQMQRVKHYWFVSKFVCFYISTWVSLRWNRSAKTLAWHTQRYSEENADDDDDERWWFRLADKIDAKKTGCSRAISFVSEFRQISRGLLVAAGRAGPVQYTTGERNANVFRASCTLLLLINGRKVMFTRSRLHSQHTKSISVGLFLFLAAEAVAFSTGNWVFRFFAEVSARGRHKSVRIQLG